MFRLVIRLNARLMVAGRLEIQRDGQWQVCGVFQMGGREWRRLRKQIQSNVEVIYERKRSTVPA